MKIKIFCIYHKSAPIWKSDCIEPIQSGAFKHPAISPEILRDNVGDNISHKNDNYGEMSVWYWVWKNYIPENPQLDYIGFCHYRRFLNFSPNFLKGTWNKMYLSKFNKIFNKWYNSKNINSHLTADILVPRSEEFNKTLREQFNLWHPVDEWDRFEQIVLNRHPQHAKLIKEVLQGTQCRICLNFVMKKELFIDFMEWIFPLLYELEACSDWSKFRSYNDVRTPAYLAERYFNVWLNIVQHEKDVTICELPGIFITSKPSIWKRIAKPLLCLLPRRLRIEIRNKWKSELEL